MGSKAFCHLRRLKPPGTGTSLLLQFH
ncbi:hypothetical protein CCACVL1_29465 [Corchorus capsularis]|uniref:Uncharacterized protein n=1 Tax=Corchorus capsularis TaxID=210143 RepID=A0A1R3G1N1_COCAP|nr:hypothetical protein CCACVL1_29465 [Corchorus capsularis]